MITICCVCKKTKKNNLWVSLPISNQDHISHGYCPQCFRKVLAEIHANHPSYLPQYGQQG